MGSRADPGVWQDKESGGRRQPATVVSVVVPAFNEEENLPAVYRELEKILSSGDLAWEIILVDDGSSDGTWDCIEMLHQQDQRVKGLRLSKNFGHQFAILAGLRHATGQAAITMDADLQHPPGCIPELIEKWRQGYRIVNTRRLDPSSASFFKKITSRLYYAVFSWLSGERMEAGMSDFRLVDRQVMAAMLQFPEKGLFWRGLVQWTGFAGTTVTFQAGKRHRGRSKYSLAKMLSFAWTGISTFSVVPLRLAVLIGALTSLLAFLELGYAVFIKLFTDQAIPGWASAVSVVSFLFGILFILLGIVGEYIGCILLEVKGRPRYFISDQTGFEQIFADR